MTDLSAFESYEIDGFETIEKVLREKRGLPITFRAAYHIWSEFSDSYYSAGWMSMVDMSNIEESILKAYDEFFPTFIHRCEKDDPWTPEKSKKAYHVDAVNIGGECFVCPHCDREWKEK